MKKFGSLNVLDDHLFRQDQVSFERPIEQTPKNTAISSIEVLFTIQREHVVYDGGGNVDGDKVVVVVREEVLDALYH